MSSTPSPSTPTAAKPDIDVNALMRGLVHELRNPLSAILTASSLLQPNQTLDEESEMLIGVVQKESRRMNRILTEFSTFVKPPTPYVEDFDVAELLRDVVRQLQKDEGFSSHVTVKDEMPAQLWVSGDMMLSAQVLRHVLTNSVEAMEQGGTLRFRPGPSSGEFCIEDSGSGPAHGVLERAFQPFFSTKPAATGLGLSISRGLLQAFGGQLELEALGDENCPSSGTCQGARVRIHLPEAQTVAQSAPPLVASLTPE